MVLYKPSQHKTCELVPCSVAILVLLCIVSVVTSIVVGVLIVKPGILALDFKVTGDVTRRHHPDRLKNESVELKILTLTAACPSKKYYSKIATDGKNRHNSRIAARQMSEINHKFELISHF